MTGEPLRLDSWKGRPVEAWQERWGVPVLEIHARTGSTNDVARALAEAGAPEGAVVLAEEQTAGRGRGGRAWHAPPGTALLLSILLRPRIPDGGIEAPGGITLRIGLAVATALERVTGTTVGIKWPNDLILPGLGKVGGILCEGAIGGGNSFLVAGIGINVAQRAADFPRELQSTATSISIATGAPVSRAALAGAIIPAVLETAPSLVGPLDPETLEGIARRDVLRGHPIMVDAVYRGTALGIAPDAALLVRDDRGRIAAIRDGTVRVVDDPVSTPSD